MWDNGKVDDLGGDKDAPVSYERRDVCLQAHIARIEERIGDSPHISHPLNCLVGFPFQHAHCTVKEHHTDCSPILCKQRIEGAAGDTNRA